MSYIDQALQLYLKSANFDKEASDEGLEILQSLSFVDSANPSLTVKLAAYITAEVENQVDQGKKDVTIEVVRERGNVVQAFRKVYEEEGLESIRDIFAHLEGKKLKKSQLHIYRILFRGQEVKAPSKFNLDLYELYQDYIVKRGKAELGLALDMFSLEHLVKAMCNELGIEPEGDLKLNWDPNANASDPRDSRILVNGKEALYARVFEVFPNERENVPRDLQTYKIQGQPLPSKIEMEGYELRNVKQLSKDMVRIHFMNLREDSTKLISEWRSTQLLRYLKNSFYDYEHYITSSPFSGVVKQFESRLQKDNPEYYLQLTSPNTTSDPEVQKWVCWQYIKHSPKLNQRAWSKLKIANEIGPYKHDPMLDKQMGRLLMAEWSHLWSRGRTPLDRIYGVIAWMTLVHMIQNMLRKDQSLTLRELKIN